MDIAQTTLVTIEKIIVVFAMITIYTRLSSSQRIGAKFPTNQVSQIMLGAMAGSVLLNESISLLMCIIGVGIVCLILLTVQVIKLKFPRARHLLDGDALQLIRGGRVQTEVFKRNSVQYSYVQSLMGDVDIDDIENMWLKTDNTLKMDLKRDKANSVHVLVDSGTVNGGGLEEIEHDEKWLEAQLQEYGITIDDTFIVECCDDLLTIVDRDGNVVNTNEAD